MPWYARALPQLDPRLQAASPLSSVAPIVDMAYAKGLSVASAEIRLLWHGGMTPELRGILFVLNKETKSNFGKSTLESALRLCPYIDQLRTLPLIADPIERNLYAHFARAYTGAAQYLRNTGKKEEADISEAIGEELKRGRRSLAWSAACRELKERIHPTPKEETKKKG